MRLEDDDVDKVADRVLEKISYRIGAPLLKSALSKMSAGLCFVAATVAAYVLGRWLK